MPELLAPAGSWDSLAAAVNAGADAVYLSGTRFGARNYADNFDEETLLRAIEFSHLRGVMVYVAVNTLIHDDELQDALEFLSRIYRMGADAVLVQDFGLASLARMLIPGLSLHASTQMTIHNREGVMWAASKGFKRVVLARELAAEEIERIGKKQRPNDIGLEIFVHGALCYCYSGQCLLSSVMGGRSGNRGMCAQPCRKPFELVAASRDGFGRPVNLSVLPAAGCYLLSTRDISVYPDLGNVVRLPVAALKIEGRMRNPHYVATVVSVYRHALDRIAGGNFSPSSQDIEDLTLAFNRGFTRGYILGSRLSGLMGRERPDNRGLCIGKVVSASGGTITVHLDSDVLPENGDGLVVIDRGGREEGIVLSSSPSHEGGTVRIPVRSSWKPGAEVFLTRRARLIRQAEMLAALPYPGQARIPVDLKVGLTPDRRLEIHATAFPRRQAPVAVTVLGEPLAPAATAPLTAGQIERQLSRTGGSVFSVRNIGVVYAGGMFAPISSVNALRRHLLLELEGAITNAWRPDAQAVAATENRLGSITASLYRGPGSTTPGSAVPCLAAYTDSAEVARGAAKAGAEIIYLEVPSPAPEHCVHGKGQPNSGFLLDELSAMAGACHDQCSRPVWKWPRICDRSWLEAAWPVLGELPGIRVGEVQIEGPGIAEAIQKRLPGTVCSGGQGLNVFNHRTVDELCPPFSRLTLSPELSAREIKILASYTRGQNQPGLEMIVEGNIEAVVSEDCILTATVPTGPACSAGKTGTFRGIRDEKGRIFPVHLDGSCRTHIQNAMETCLIDHLPRIASMGIGTVAIDLRGRTLRYAEIMTGLYKEALERLSSGKPEGFHEFKERARAISLGGITAGHFLRGVQER